MKINSTIAKFMAAGAILFGSVACTGDYIDYNKNPHEPDLDQMLPDDYLFSALLLNMQDVMMPEQEKLFSVCGLFNAWRIFRLCCRL